MHRDRRVPGSHGLTARCHRVGVDVGGTFTDLVALANGEVVTAKVSSTPEDQSVGVLSSVRASGVDATAIDAISHGTTVATNALLERRGVRTALITTDGFRDILEICRQNRPSMYDLSVDRPLPLVPRELRFTVKERVVPEGELLPLDEASLERAVFALREAEVEAVGVCLLFSFARPEHERRVGDVVRESLPGVHVSLSAEVLPEFREFERFSTTVADAYLAPKLGVYLSNLAAKVEEAGMPRPLVMQSSGGVTEIGDAARRAAACVLSGPAGGVVGAAFVAEASGYRDLLTFDMGGTSTDVAPVVDGQVQITTEAVVAGVPIKFPMVDVHTVSAGGGSIAWVDEGGALRVGPHSAGANPGPASYGRGGEDATVTDANVVVGYLSDTHPLGGELALRPGLAEKALEELGRKLDMSALDAALGVIQVADAEMVRALRVISVERGLDPREFVLVAFGGAGPLHACALADELDIRKVLVPKTCGVLSALGLAISDLRRDYVSPLLAGLDPVLRTELEAAFTEMERRGSLDLATPRFQRLVDLRYRGQSFELTVDAEPLEDLKDRFHAAHERRYGFRMEDEPIELVNLRVVATVPGAKPELRERGRSSRAREAERRRANFAGEWLEVEVLDRNDLGWGSEVEGPAIVEFTEATCVVRRGWSGGIDDAGTLVLERA